MGHGRRRWGSRRRQSNTSASKLVFSIKLSSESKVSTACLSVRQGKTYGRGGDRSLRSGRSIMRSSDHPTRTPSPVLFTSHVLSQKACYGWMPMRDGRRSNASINILLCEKTSIPRKILLMTMNLTLTRIPMLGVGTKLQRKGIEMSLLNQAQ